MIKDVRRLYSNIPQDIFKEIIELDPTYKGNNSVGKYTKWMMARYLKHDFDKNHIKDLLQQFIEKKPYLANKDIGSYKSCKDLEDALSQVKIEKTKRQKLRELQNKIRNASIEEDKIYEDDEWEIYIPSTYENSCKLGQGTKWCTASNSNDYYFDHYIKKGELYILINKKDNVKYQFHFESKQFMDKEDESIDIWNFFINYPHLKNIFNIETKGDFITRNKEILLSNPNKPFITLDDNIDFEINGFKLGNTCVKLIITKNQRGELNIAGGSKLYEIYNLSKQKLSRDLDSMPNVYTSLDEPSKLKVSNGVIYYIDENEKMAVAPEDMNVTNIILDDDCTEINLNAFSGCRNLTSVNIPNSVTSIGDSAFWNCRSLKYNIYDNAKYLGNNENPYLVLIAAINTDITTCTINSNTKIIYGDAFRSCSILKSITIPNGVINIGDSVFSFCSSLTSINIPDSVTDIELCTFSDCSSLQYNTYNNAKYLGNNENQYLVLVEAINTYITTCTINSNTRFICNSAFYNCSKLKSINIPNSVISVGSSAFENCYGLVNMIIGKDVKRFFPFSIQFCNNLKKIYYKGTKEQWESIKIYKFIQDDILLKPRYYYSETKPIDSGDYWHYDRDGKIIEWGI